MNKKILVGLGLVIIFLIALTGCTETETEITPSPQDEQSQEGENQSEQTPPPETPQLGSRQNPAPIGTSLIYNVTNDLFYGDYSVKITVLEVIRGDEAWQMIHDANIFNDPPPQGYEYILAKIRFEYLWNSDPDRSIDISQYSFDAFSEDGVKYESPMLVTPDPQLSTTLYPGGTKEGWGAYQVAIDDEHPLLVYDQVNGGAWFKLYYS